MAARIPAEVATVNVREDAAGRRWGLLTAVLTGGIWGPLGYAVFERFLRWGTCYDIQGDPDTQQACDTYTAKIAASSGIVLVVAVLSAVVMVPVGVADGARGLAFAAGPARPLWLLILGNPAAFVACLIGWLLGRAGRRLAHPK